MGIALEAAAVAARAASDVRAALLRLVAAVLACRAAGPSGPAAAVVHHGEGLLAAVAGGPIRGGRLLVPELDGASGRHGRLAVAVAGGGGGVSVDEGALRRGDEREHGIVGGRPLLVVVVERARGRDHEHPDVTGGAYRPVAERGGGGGGSGGLVARRRGPPEPCRQRGASASARRGGDGAGIETQGEVIPAAGAGAGGRRQPARDRRGVGREAPPRRRRHAYFLLVESGAEVVS